VQADLPRKGTDFNAISPWASPFSAADTKLTAAIVALCSRPRGTTKGKKAATRAKAKPATIDRAAVDAKRAKAYGDMEPHVCDLAHAATLAMEVFDQSELFLFAVTLCHRQLQSRALRLQNTRQRRPALKNVFVASHGLPNPIFWEDLALEI